MYDAQKTKDRIMDLCKERGVSCNKLLADAGLGVNALRQISPERGISSVSLAKIADRLGCSVDYLLGREEDFNAETLHGGKNYLVPLYESISAGLGATASSAVLDYVPLRFRSPVDAQNALCIIVRGDSMSPKIEDGDIVLVIRDIAYENGDIVAVMTNNETGYVKKIYDYPAKVILRSINPTYDDIVIQKAETDLKVVGVVKKIMKDV